jgi:hypothetical protein
MSKQDNMTAPRRFKTFFVATLFMLMACLGMAHAQSTERDNPTPLASNEIKGEGPGKDAVYYYSFTAGPGEVTITVDLKATAYSTAVRFELLDADSNQLLAHNMNATSARAERVVRRVDVREKRAVILKLVVDSNTGEYMVRLSGAVEFGGSGKSPGGSPSATPGNP